MTMEGGVFESASPETVILDSSTISSVFAKEMNEAARENNMYFYDSPMSGGVPGAANQTLTFMVGIDEEDQ